MRSAVLFVLLALLRMLEDFGVNAGEVVLSGARPGSALEKLSVSSNQHVRFTIFGENLDEIDDFWMTTADRCSDAEVLMKPIVRLKARNEFSDSYARVVEAPNGFPENVVEFYRLCIGENATDGLSLPTLKIVSDDQSSARPIPLYALIILYIALLFLSALFSGLNLAFLCVTMNELTLIEQSDNEMESAFAHKIIPLRRRGNWLICTFATGNAVANIACTLLMDSIWEGHPQAFIAATTVPVALSVIFAEIIPQAICNRRGLCVASKTRFVTLFFMGLFAPFTFPISKILDWTLGTHGLDVYDRGRIAAMIKLQADTNENERDIIQRAFKLPMITVGTVMTPINDAFLLSTNDVLDTQRMIQIMEKGYTRIPVYEGHNRGKVVAILNVKDLVFAQPEKKLKVGEICDKMNYGKQIRFVTEEMRARPLMSEMIKGHQHLAMVVRYQQKTYRLVGLITLEDIIEEIVGEIQDDTDASWTNQRAGLHRDQATLDWLRAPMNPHIQLSSNEQLEMIQYLLKACPAFGKLSMNIHAMIKLLNLSQMFLTGNGKEVKVISKDERVRSVFVLIKGEATSGNESFNGKRRAIFGSETVEQLFAKYAREGLMTETSEIGYVAGQDLLILEDSMFLKIRLENIIEVLVHVQNDKWQREIVEGVDCYLNNLISNSQSAGSSGERIIAALKTVSPCEPDTITVDDPSTSAKKKTSVKTVTYKETKSSTKSRNSARKKGERLKRSKRKSKSPATLKHKREMLKEMEKSTQTETNSERKNRGANDESTQSSKE